MNNQSQESNQSINRRDFLKFGLAATSVAVVPKSLAVTSKFQSKAKIVIVGVGAAGTAIANRLTDRIEGADITIVGARQEHLYQPGLTLVAAGIWKGDRLLTKTQQWLPNGIKWKPNDAVSFEPNNNRLTLDDSSILEYDVLIIATGCQLNYEKIEGMSVDLIGKNGIGSVYAGPKHAENSFKALSEFIEKGKGEAIFTLPNTPLKCAGAPLKMTFISLDLMEKSGKRDQFNAHFYTPYADRVFSIKLYNDFVIKRWEEQNLTLHRERNLTGIDDSSKKAFFTLPDGSKNSVDYDYIHVVPPMSAPNAVKNSDLVWSDGPMKGDWVEADQITLQHKRFENIFAIGDVVGAPLGKTAASVKKQVPIVVENMISYLSNQPFTQKYDGYTSCPLITALGKAILAEFGYDQILMPSFPFIDPTKESWFAWVMEEKMLQPAYYAMLNGKI